MVPVIVTTALLPTVRLPTIFCAPSVACALPVYETLPLVMPPASACAFQSSILPSDIGNGCSTGSGSEVSHALLLLEDAWQYAVPLMFESLISCAHASPPLPPTSTSSMSPVSPPT